MEAIKQYKFTMEKINFVSAWRKKRETTWSGTIWGLFCSLSKYYDLININIGNEKYPFIKRVWQHIFGGDLGYSQIKQWKKKLSNNINAGVYFQFAGIVQNQEGVRTYIFQDCSVNSVLYFAKHKSDSFRNSNFSHCKMKWIEKRAMEEMAYYRTCSGIFTLCHWLVDDLVNRLGLPAEKVHYAGCGINVDYDKIDDGKRVGNKILFVGIDFKRKGGFLVVDAFKKLKERIPNVELYIAGPRINPIREKIAGYHFMGRCDRNQLNDLYNKCDVFAMPSYFEAFGIVFAEALCFGLPCLGRKCFDMPIIIDEGKTGELIENDNVEIAAQKLYDLLVQNHYKQKVKENRNYYLKEYSWDKVAERIHNVIG